MDAAVQGFRHLGVDLPAKAGQAAEGRLDVAAGAAEAVVEIEVAEGGVEVVRHIRRTTRRPSQTHSGLPAGPLMACAASTNSSVLRWLSLVASGRLRRVGGRFAGLVLGAGIAALGNGASEPDQQGKAGDGKVPQNRAS